MVVTLAFIVPVSYFEASVFGTSVDVLPDVNVNISTGVMTALEFPMSIPEEACSCCAPFGRRDLAVFNCDRVLQIRIPSDHVW